MKPAEKRALIFDPLLQVYTGDEWFKRGDTLWRICRREGFAIEIIPELSMGGYFLVVFVCFGSFYAGVEREHNGAPLMSEVIILPKMCTTWDRTEDATPLCRAQATAYVQVLSSSPWKELFSAQTYEEFVSLSASINSFKKTNGLAEKRAWDIMHSEGRDAALRYLDKLLTELECARPLPGAYIDRCKEAQAIIRAIDEDSVDNALQERYKASEMMFSSYFKRKWKTLESMKDYPS